MRLDFFLFTLIFHLPTIDRTGALLHSSKCPILPLLLVLYHKAIRAQTYANATSSPPSFATVRNNRDYLLRVKRKPIHASSSSQVVGGMNKRILSSPVGLLESAEEMEKDGTSSSQPPTWTRSAFKKKRTKNSATDWNETAKDDENKNKGRKGSFLSHPFTSRKAGVKDNRSTSRRTGLVQGKACSKPIRQNFIDIGERLKQIRETATNARGFAATFKK